MWRTIFYKWCLGNWLIFTLWVLMACLLSAVLVFFMLRRRREKRVDCFFEKYEPKEGIVREYILDEAVSCASNRSTSNGKTTALQLNFHDLPEAYYIQIECHNYGKRFLLMYEISAEEFKAKKPGSSIRIHESWIPYGYIELDNK